MKYDDVSELMIKREHNILIVGNSASHIDKFFKGYSIPGSKYYDFTQINSKRLVRTVLIFTESSDQLSRATDRVPGLPASPGYVQ